MHYLDIAHLIGIANTFDQGQQIVASTLQRISGYDIEAIVFCVVNEAIILDRHIQTCAGYYYWSGFDKCLYMFAHPVEDRTR